MSYPQVQMCLSALGPDGETEASVQCSWLQGLDSLRLQSTLNGADATTGLAASAPLKAKPELHGVSAVCEGHPHPGWLRFAQGPTAAP